MHRHSRKCSLAAAIWASLCTGCSFSPDTWNETKTSPQSHAAGIVLAKVSESALSDDCAAGGVDIATGVDKNADGELSADEVDRVLTLCHGASGKNAVVETEELEAGDDCSAGGLRVRSGLDANGDGQLSASEIIRNDVICNGAAGADGLTSLVVITSVDPGDVCASGGVTLRMGLDVNGDGLLSAAEVHQEATVCNGSQGAPGEISLTTIDGQVGDACDDYGNGGQRIRSGVDNGDGGGVAGNAILEDGEVDTTTYVCNGANGTPGVRGDAGPAGADGSLLRLERELGGPICPYSGTRILSGVDDDGDGLLQDDEVDDEAVVCSSSPGECAEGYHDGGAGACVLIQTCSTGYALNPAGVCTSHGYVDGGYYEPDAGDGSGASDAGLEDVNLPGDSGPPPPGAECGNGVVETGEDCDDGNQAQTDACKNNCQFNVCGDGFIDTNQEQCDDSNTANGDGCSAVCLNEPPPLPHTVNLTGQIMDRKYVEGVYQDQVTVRAINAECGEQTTCTSSPSAVPNGDYVLQGLPPQSALILQLRYHETYGPNHIPVPVGFTTSVKAATYDNFQETKNLYHVKYNWLAQVAYECGVYDDITNLWDPTNYPTAALGNVDWIRYSFTFGQLKDGRGNGVPNIHKDRLEVELGGYVNDTTSRNPNYFCWLEAYDHDMDATTPDIYRGTTNNMSYAAGGAAFVIFKVVNNGNNSGTGIGTQHVRVKYQANGLNFAEQSIPVQAGNVSTVTLSTNAGVISEPVVDLVDFDTEIYPTFAAYGCTACHSPAGTYPSLDLSGQPGDVYNDLIAPSTLCGPPTDPNNPRDANPPAYRVCVDYPKRAKLALMPLLEVPPNHPNASFADDNDPTLRIYEAWMEQGALRRAASDNPDAGPSEDGGEATVPTDDPGTVGASTFTEHEIVVIGVPYDSPVESDMSNDGDAADGGTLVGDAGLPTFSRVIELSTFVPDGEGPFEPVIIVPGFGLAPVYYQSLAEHLASHGYLATLIDLNASTNPRPSHAEMASYLADAVDWLEDQNADGAELAGLMDMEKLAFVGHSMGGKLSLLLASTDARPQAVFAIDPVDALPPLTMPSSEFPSVTPELMGDIDIPVVYVGETTNAMSAGFGQACAPAEDNFQQYYMYSTGPALEIDVKGANHMSFIEPDLLCIACLACSQGTDDPEVTRALTRRWMVAFFDLVLRGDESRRAWLTGAFMQAEADQQRVTFQTKNGF